MYSIAEIYTGKYSPLNQVVYIVVVWEIEGLLWKRQSHHNLPLSLADLVEES